MVNILPKEVRDSLKARYYRGLFSTFFILATLIVLAGGALLAPSYLLSRDEAAGASRFTAALLETLSLRGDVGASRDLALLAAEANILGTYAEAPLSARTLEGVLQALPRNVVLSKIGIDATGETKMISLSGMAQNRAALIDFVNALRDNTAFAGVSVPVANLAQENDIVFSFSFSLQQP